MSAKDLDALLRKAATTLLEWMAVVAVSLVIGYIIFQALDGRTAQIGDRIVISFHSPF